MPRPKNSDLEQKIRDVAWQQFLEHGYEQTSYASIAEACEISRGLVQYHFPKKQILAIQLMQDALVQSQTALECSDSDMQHDLSSLYAVGCVFFTYFLQSSGGRRFLFDIIQSRDLTEEVLAFNASWAFERINIQGQTQQKRLMHTVIVQMGGFYELLYHCLKNDESIDVIAGLKTVMTFFAEALAHSEDDAGSLLPDARLANIFPDDQQFRKRIETCAASLKIQ